MPSPDRQQFEHQRDDHRVGERGHVKLLFDENLSHRRSTAGIETLLRDTQHELKAMDVDDDAVLLAIP